jgi:hypothetical protein
MLRNSWPLSFLRRSIAGGGGGGGGIDGTLGSTDAGIVAAAFFTVSGGTVTVVGQKNVASVTRLVTGVFRVTFNSALANNNYGVIASARAPSDTTDRPMMVQPNRDSAGGRNSYSTSAVDVAVQYLNAAGISTTNDPVSCMVVVYDPQSVSSSNYGAAASWTLASTTLTLQRQLNVSSMSRHAVGVYRANFSSALPNADYAEFPTTRYPDFGAVANALAGQNRNTGIPSNLHTTTALDLSTAQLNQNGGFFEPARGSVLIGNSNVAPRGTIARARFSVSGGVATLVESYNVASVTWQATGMFRLLFTLPCIDADYAVAGSAKLPNSTDDAVAMVGANCNSTASRDLYATSGVDVAAQNFAATAVDPAFVNVWVLKPWLM